MSSAPKKSNKKISLNEFLTPATGKTDWADDDFDLPTAPAPKTDFGGSILDFAPDRKDRDFGGYGGVGGFGRELREPRPDVPLPTEPPFTAFVGSMSFDSTESDVSAFFEGLPVTTVRIVTEGFTGKSKGFGYVEFATLDALKDALARSGGQITGRAVRISVAEPPRQGGFSSAADDASQWRRSGPAPTSTRGSTRPSFSGRGGFDDGPSGFDSMEISGGARAGFGSKFNPSTAAPRSGNRFGGGDFDPNAGDDAANWRTGKPIESRQPPTRKFSHGPSTAGDDVVLDRSAFGQKVNVSPSPAPQREDRSTRGFGFARQAPDADVTLDRSAFGAKMSSPAPEQAPRRGGFERQSSSQRTSPATTPAETADQWRRAGGPASPKNTSRERQPLKLQPRTSTAPKNAEAAPSSGKPSPFGAAKPVDNAEREREIEARLQERRRSEQRKQQETKSSKPPTETGSQGTPEDDAAPTMSGPKHPPTNPWKSVPAKKQGASSGPAAQAASSTAKETSSAEDTKDVEKKLEETKLE